MVANVVNEKNTAAIHCRWQISQMENMQMSNEFLKIIQKNLHAPCIQVKILTRAWRLKRQASSVSFGIMAYMATKKGLR